MSTTLPVVFFSAPRPVRVATAPKNTLPLMPIARSAPGPIASSTSAASRSRNSIEIAAQPAHAVGLRARDGEHLLAAIDGGDVRAFLREAHGVTPRSARDVEDALAAHVSEDALHERLFDRDERVRIRVVMGRPVGVALLDGDGDALHFSFLRITLPAE